MRNQGFFYIRIANKKLLQQLAYITPVYPKTTQEIPEKVSVTRSKTYRYGFNGKEKDDEVEGTGNWQDYGERMYSPRLGRFPSVDPLTKKYPWYSPYQFAGNMPIRFIDLDGAEPKDPPGMWLSTPGSHDYGDHYGNGGNLTRVNDITTGERYFVSQQNAANGGSSFHWYNSDVKAWQSFTPTGYVELGSWQNTDQGQGNFAAFQGAIRSNQGMLSLAAGFAAGAASFAGGGLGSMASSGFSLLRGATYERLAGGLSDMGIQLLSGKSFGSNYNYASTVGNVLFPNSPLISAAIGSYGEFNASSGFTLGEKGFMQATIETGINTAGNVLGDKIGKYGVGLPSTGGLIEKLGMKLGGGAVGNGLSGAASEIANQPTGTGN